LARLGDSRAYRLRSGRIKQLTKDHSLIQMLLDSGELSSEEAATYPASGRLARHVGMEGEPLPQTRLLQLKVGDLVLLCTDGLTNLVGEHHIRDTLAKLGCLTDGCQRLIKAANRVGGPDNTTVVLMKVVSAEQGSAQVNSYAELSSASVSKQSRPQSFDNNNRTKETLYDTATHDRGHWQSGRSKGRFGPEA
jgi:protein phosphatase